MSNYFCMGVMKDHYIGFGDIEGLVRGKCQEGDTVHLYCRIGDEELHIFVAVKKYQTRPFFVPEMDYAAEWDCVGMIQLDDSSKRKLSGEFIPAGTVLFSEGVSIKEINKAHEDGTNASYLRNSENPDDGAEKLLPCPYCDAQIYAAPNKTLIRCPFCGKEYSPRDSNERRYYL